MCSYLQLCHLRVHCNLCMSSDARRQPQLYCTAVNRHPLGMMELHTPQYKLTGAHSASGQGAICWSPCEGWWSYGPNLYYLAVVSKALVFYCQQYMDKASKKETENILTQYDWPLLVGDPCRCESRKFRGLGACA